MTEAELKAAMLKRWPGLAEYDDEGQNYYLDQARAIFAREQAEEDEG